MPAIRNKHLDICPAGAAFNRSVRKGNLLFVSGCTARGSDAQGKPLMDQLRVTLDRMTRVVAAEGGSASDILKLTTFVTSIPDWRAHDDEQAALFQEFFNGEFPANSLIEITGLAAPDLYVEIEATAVLD